MAKKKSDNLFLFLKNENIVIFKTLEEIESLPFKEILILAKETNKALKLQLFRDAIIGDHYIENTKVVDGFNRGLQVLFSYYPVLRSYLITDEQYQNPKRNIN